MRFVQAFLYGTLKGGIVLGVAGFIAMFLVGLMVHGFDFGAAIAMGLAGLIGMTPVGLVFGGAAGCLHALRTGKGEAEDKSPL